MGEKAVKIEKDEYTGSLWQYIEKNQVSLSGSLLILGYIIHNSIPTLNPYTSKFIQLQYKIGQDENGTSLYDIGIDDCYMVMLWVILLTFLRSFLMNYLWGPFASYFYNMKSNQVTRFAEQSWSCYFAAFSFGFSWYIYYNSPYYNNLNNLFIDWPHDDLLPRYKVYYLLQIGFWFQQIFVLNVEKKRKDYIQMFSHHIVTCLLLIGSYYYYFIRIGNLILILMDPVDIFLSGAKLLKYCGYTRLCDIMFILFLFSWIILRHICYNYIFYHAWSNAQNLMSESVRCDVGVDLKRCWSPKILDGFYCLLGGLQIITLIWLYFIFRVAYKVITGKNAEDVRSDSEDDDEVEDDIDDQNEKDEPEDEVEVEN